LGVVFQGESTRINQWVRNQSDKEIHTAKIEKSCECLDVRLSKSQIASGERVLAHFTYNGTKEPDFVGSLLIEVTFSDENEKNVGRIEVPIEVLSKKDHLSL